MLGILEVGKLETFTNVSHMVSVDYSVITQEVVQGYLTRLTREKLSKEESKNKRKPRLWMSFDLLVAKLA